jgi:hypothetical protein
MANKLPTARSMIKQEFLCLLVFCKACHHQAPADLQSIIDSGRGGVTMAKDALRVRPWRREAG